LVLSQQALPRFLGIGLGGRGHATSGQPRDALICAHLFIFLEKWSSRPFYLTFFDEISKKCCLVVMKNKVTISTHVCKAKQNFENGRVLMKKKNN